MRKRGDLSPKVVALKGKEVFICSLPPDQDAWFSFVMTMLRAVGAASYFVAFEAWAVPVNQIVDTLPTSENPARTERVFVFGYKRSGDKIALSQQFVLDPGGIKFLKPVNVCRRWDSLMPVPENW